MEDLYSIYSFINYIKLSYLIILIILIIVIISLKMTLIYYSLNDFNTILFINEYKLDFYVLNIISELNSKIGVNTSERPIQKDDKPLRNRNRKSTVFSNEGRTEEAWEHLRSFKATVIEKKTDGIEKTLNEIRICLNKISQKNYDTIKELIIDSIDTISKTENSEESMRNVVNHIFDIASTNKFFSEMYAKLYKLLISKYDIFQNILTEFISTFTDKLRDIVWVDQNTNYDDFCTNNKVNDARKATAVFIVNLMKNNVLDKSILLKVTQSAMDIVLEYIETTEKVNQVEEITENIFLLVSESHSYMKGIDGWVTILEKINEISQMKSKEKPSLSSRAVFKYRDITDKYKL